MKIIYAMSKKIATLNNGIADNQLEDGVRLYWETLMLITPNIFKTETYPIYFYHPEKNQPVVKIYRMCVKYLDGYFGVQDELFFPSVNTGGQVNFEVTKELWFNKSPDVIHRHVQKFIDECKALVSVRGASIYVQGYGFIYESDGVRWVRAANAPSLPEGSMGLMSPLETL